MNCQGLTEVSFPNATSIGTSAFTRCQHITTATFPECTAIGSYAFYDDSRLINISFPNCLSVGWAAFYNCYSLTTASFPKCAEIYHEAFVLCYNLVSLYLMGSSVVSLHASGAFRSTPIGGYSTSAGQYGSIYVPASLLTAYQTADYWSDYASRFVGV